MKSRKRSIVKTISWRIICLITGFLVTWLMMGDIIISGAVAIVLNSVNTVLYYIHERSWNRL